MKKQGATFLAALAGGLLSLGIYKLVWPDQPSYQIIQSAPPVHQSAYDVLPTAAGVDFTVAAEKTVNSVVHIKTVSNVRNTRQSNPFDFFFGNPFQQGPRAGSGSGVIISANGYILTNNHVIEGADEILVTLNDKRDFAARLIGADPNTDLAVLQIEAENLPAVTFSNSDQVKVGQWALAIGNPFNLSSTVTAGIVSAKGRNIDIIQENYKIESFIQTDAAVNPGNSGGALVNTQGELIGINTAIASNTGTFTGYSFAIPSNLAKKVAQDLIEFGVVQRGLLGVNIREINAEFAKDRGITGLEGVWVEAPLPGSAAEDAGLKNGDIILKINDVNINSVSELQEHVGLYRPGDKIQVTIRRENALKTIPVTLKNKAGTTSVVESGSEVMETLGAVFSQPTGNELKRLGLAGGVKVEEVKSGKLKMIGIKPGFIITEVNGKVVRNADELQKALQGAQKFMIGGAYPTGERVFYSFY